MIYPGACLGKGRIIRKTNADLIGILRRRGGGAMVAIRIRIHLIHFEIT